MGRHLDHREPNPRDVKVLRDAAPCETGTEPAIDDLAAQIIDEEVKKGRSKPARSIAAVESERAS
jgi:hypothetical protein